jgi:hypothetical protein
MGEVNFVVLSGGIVLLGEDKVLFVTAGHNTTDVELQCKSRIMVIYCFMYQIL